MAKFATFLYASGTLYGVSTSLASVDPIRGPSPGGNKFLFTGSGFDPRQWDDDFTGLVLDPTKWLDISGGTGSVSTGPLHLQLSTGAAPGSGAMIESVASWGDVQGEIRFTIPPIVEYPTGTVIPMMFALYDAVANDYVWMYLTLDTEPDSLQLNIGVYRAGVLVGAMTVPIPWTSGLGIFKILRWGSDIYCYANDELVFRSEQFTTAAAKFQIFMMNQATTYDLQGVRVEWFYYRPFAIFQNQPVHNTTVVSNTRMRGLVPASLDTKLQPAAYEGFVDIHVVGNGTVTLPLSYEYYYLDHLKVIDSVQTDVRLSIIDDGQLLTPTDVQKGLGVK